jgi:NAD-dependent deacetylase
MKYINEIKDLIQNAKKIVVFTGAGISVPSGIPDFRSSNGLYNQESGFKASPEEIISHSFFIKHTKEFYEFYKEKMIYPNAKPNIAHNYFSELETSGKNIVIITQNIDGLHSIAGNKNVLELHGTVHENFCMKCKKKYDLNVIINNDEIPKCSCGGTIKPNVVLYEEELNYNTLYNSIKEISESDLLIVIGTSLVVQPAASLIRYFSGNNIIILNKEKTPYDRYAKYVINDDITNIINKIKSYSHE